MTDVKSRHACMSGNHRIFSKTFYTFSSLNHYKLKVMSRKIQLNSPHRIYPICVGIPWDVEERFPSSSWGKAWSTQLHRYTLHRCSTANRLLRRAWKPIKILSWQLGRCEWPLLLEKNMIYVWHYLFLFYDELKEFLSSCCKLWTLH